MPLITSIQKYSIHDGDGIRTTVFFKGCPLSCAWCHNPETQNYGKDVLYDGERCTGCGSCVAACPEHAIKANEKQDSLCQVVNENGTSISENIVRQDVNKNGTNIIGNITSRVNDKSKMEKVSTNLSKCTRCGTCTDYCVNNLREIAGKEYTVDELVKELKKDEMFYEESGGGVTLSGGEVMTSDMDFVEQLVKKLHRLGISVYVDTCGFAPYENFERILPYVDTFLYDVKIMDAELHKQYTGVDNELILHNLERLSQDGARIYLRIPVIKEVNGTVEQMKEIISYLKEKNIHPVQIHLLPYHNTGASKYDRLGQSYEGKEFHAPSDKEMEELAELFRQAGFSDVQIGG